MRNRPDPVAGWAHVKGKRTPRKYNFTIYVDPALIVRHVFTWNYLISGKTRPAIIPPPQACHLALQKESFAMKIILAVLSMITLFPLAGAQKSVRRRLPTLQRSLIRLLPLPMM
jgi:hypothetical protein